jgi:hypothetical protein
MADAPATTSPQNDTIAKTIADVADQFGIPPEVALAVAYQESKLNPGATGDRGYFRDGQFVPDKSGPPTSFGLYQLHQGGELGKLSQSAAFDAYTNASVAIPIIAKARKAHPNYTWGQVVAAAQRPANQQAYAARIDSILTNYRTSKLDPVSYFSKVTTYGGKSQTDIFPGNAPTGSASTPTAGSGATATGNTGPVSDWISTLDGVLNPGFGWNPLTDTTSVLKLVFVRGSITGIGLVLIGTGLLLMFGREIFGGAVMAIPGVGEVATAATAASKVTGAVAAPVR